jgi:dTDP-4-dehydrorhamnose reductase
MRILILGANGLLGNTITKYFINKSNFQTYALVRDYSKVLLFKKNLRRNIYVIDNIFDLSSLEKKIEFIKPNVVINCLGLINKKKNKSFNLIQNYIKINSLFPHKLYEICNKLEARLIHFSSDCIFSGKLGFYSEKDLPDPIDIYGRSKLLGEIDYENSLTIRKSAIGHELSTKNGLLEWFLNEHNFVNGYKNVIFSGLTVLELAKIIEKYILPMTHLRGILNISGESISKFDLLKIIADVYNKSIEIIPDESIKINRTLNGAQFSKLTGYKINSWPVLIKSMYEFNLLNQ